MQIEIEKIHKQKDIQNEVENLEDKYGTMEELLHKVSGDKCGNPSTVDDQILWKALKTENCEFVERIAIDTTNIFGDLSPRRLELLEYVRTHDVQSIKDLAEETNRNYKNVYDDLKALEKWGLVSLKRQGRDKKPISQVKSLRVVFHK